MFAYKAYFLLLLLCYTLSIIASAPVKVGLISLPVNGTHLAHKCIELLLAPLGGWKSPRSKMGGQHMVADKEIMALFARNKYKIIFMIRDPRDRVVSYAYKIKKLNPRVKTSISGLSLNVMKSYGSITYNYVTKIPFYKNMGDFSEYYQLYFPWFEYQDLLIIFFENLVGPKAGGTVKKQLAEIRNIAAFLEIDVSEEHIQVVADNLWGDTFSFRDPKIGRWKEFFTDKHKKVFKKTCMGQFLIDFGYEQDLSW